MANAVSDSPGFELRIDAGPEVDRLQWDVKLRAERGGSRRCGRWRGGEGVLRLGAADVIRMGGLGQSSYPDGPSYDPRGLPLVDGFEVITDRTTAPGGRHEALAATRVRSRSTRAGNPEDPDSDERRGVVLATEWVPYRQPTFVTPAFAAYVSGHSTFSRAAAEVLTAITGSEYFPDIRNGRSPPGPSRSRAGRRGM